MPITVASSCKATSLSQNPNTTADSAFCKANPSFPEETATEQKPGKRKGKKAKSESFKESRTSAEVKGNANKLVCA